MIKYRKRYGTWEYRIRYTDPLTHKQREKTQRGFRTKQEAISAAHRVELEQLPRSDEEMKDLPLKQWLQHYMKTYRKKHVSINTYAADEDAIKRVLPFFQDVTLRQLTPEQYQQFINYLQDQGYSRSTIRNTHILMHGAMKQATHNRRVSHNPCAEVRLPKKVPNEKIQYLPSDMIAPFLQIIKRRSLEQYFFFKALLETGMRKGEALALTWDDVDLNKQTIQINKSFIVRTKSIGPTKNRKNRTIRFSDSLKKELLNLYNMQNQNKLLYDELYLTELNLVFSTKDGNYLPNSTTFNTMRHACEQLEIEPLPIHSLRHTHAVLHLEAGTSMKVLQERLGHGSLEITSNVYAHVSETLEKDSMEKYEASTKRIFDVDSL
ncbi:tyrosine-type recombinase/integrase [Marinococcus luteus]|uniref:site-specific integrase n=1 Tax=Marinococcus luteus TaxID=1122204 RepID=UPI002ACD1823|nr:tyrosine-type recombinase/integrase [Marinococcus luteus]MDZ5782069.1 tyrosine-type recombinase/integrase [Marinococcus luteus]